MKRWFCAVLVWIALFCHLSTALATTPEDWDSSTPEILTADHLYSQAAALIDADSGEVLLEKNGSLRLFPASTTKIMTLLLALESGHSLDERITIPLDANNVPSDSSLIPLTVGEEMSFRDLLYGTMINSGNDGANVIAVVVSGSVEAFVAAMNRRAAELGCTDTHFANPHGYHDENHYTTALDMGRISAAAIQNETFREIVSARSYTMAATSKRAELILGTRNSLLMPDSEFYYEGAIGIKTGFHSKAGQCFVGAAERNGTTLVAVALNSDSTAKNQKWLDAIRMFDYGYAQYTPYTLAELFDRAPSDIKSVVIPNAAPSDPRGGTLDLGLVRVSDESYAYMVRNVEGAIPHALTDFSHRTKIQYRSNLRAPIDEGEILGNLSYTTPQGDEISAVMIATRSMEAGPYSVSLQELFPFLAVFQNSTVRSAALGIALVVALLIIWLLFRSAARQRRRNAIYRRRRDEYEYRRMRGDFDPQPLTRKEKRRQKRARRRDDLFGMDDF